MLVHSHEFVLDKMNAPFPSLATEALKRHGVELKLRTRAVRNTETLVYLDNDERIPCDLFISTNPPGIGVCVYVCVCVFVCCVTSCEFVLQVWLCFFNFLYRYNDEGYMAP